MPNVTKSKAENYTDSQTAEMVDAYTGAETTEARQAVVEHLAAKMGKSIRSIRSKLVAEKVYVKAAPVSKVTGAEPAKKEALAEKLVKAVGLTSASVESVAKMNKTDIVAISEFIEKLDAENANLHAELDGLFDYVTGDAEGQAGDNFPDIDDANPDDA